MSYSQCVLSKRFSEGEKSGQASHMKIKAYDDGDTAIIGYEWALYAYRTREGVIYKFCRWYGHSGSTTQQLDLIPSDYLVFSYRPSDSEVYKVKEEIKKSQEYSQAQRLREGIIRIGEHASFNSYSIRPHLHGFNIKDNDSGKELDLYLSPEVMPEFIKSISELDESKIEFMIELAKSGLNPEKYIDFDMDKLRRSKKQSEAIIEARKRYLQAFNDIPKPSIEHISDAVLIFGRYTVLVAKSYRAYARIVCTDSNSEVLLGNMIAKGKLHKKLKRQISEKHFISILLNGIKRGVYPSDSFEYLPEGAKAKAVKMKLEE